MGASVRPESGGSRIERNVAALRAQGASEHDVEAYLTQHEGLTPTHATPGQQFGTTVAQGATLGFAPKILGGIDAADKYLHGDRNFGKNYTATRDRIASAESDAMTDHPVAARVAEMAGGALAALPLSAGSAVAGAVRPTLGRQILRGAATGGLVGGVSGAGHATGGVADYAKEIGTGAGVGAVVGGAAVPVLAGLGKVGGKALTTAGLRPTGRTAEEMTADAATMRRPLGPQAGAGETPAAATIMGGPAPQRPPLAPLPTTATRARAAFGRGVEATGIESSKTIALRELAHRLQLDNVAPADAIAFAQQNAGKPVMPLDLGGGNVSGLARTAKDVPGLGRRLIPEALHERSSGTDGATLGRITSDIEQRIGLKPEDYYKSVEDMTGQMKKEAATNYGKVRGKVVDDPEVLALFNEPEWQGVHERIRTNARIAGKEKIPALTSGRAAEENIVAATIKHPDGSVTFAPSHMQALEHRGYGGWASVPMAEKTGMEEGFLTNTGRHVSREEADLIVNGPLEAPRLRSEQRAGKLPGFGGKSAGIIPAGTPELPPAQELNPQTIGTLDKMKRHLDKVIAGKIEGGPLDKDLAYSMRSRLNEALDKLDAQHPDYAAARSAYRGSAEGIDAYEAGKAEFMKLDPRAIQQKLAKMPERLQDLYRRGGYDALRADKLTKMDDGANIGAWLEKNPDIRDRVAALAKTPEAGQALRGDLGVERAMGDRKNAILGGPNTAERLIEHQATVPRVTQLGNAARMLPGVGKLAGGLVDNTLTRRMADQTGDVMGEVAKMMVSRGPTAMQELMQAIESLQSGDATKALSRSRVAGAGAALGTRDLPRR